MSGNVTVKAGRDFDAPWLVVEAPEGDLMTPGQQVEHQRDYILAAFGMDPDDPGIVDLTLAEVVAQASVHFQGVWIKAKEPVAADPTPAAKPPAKRAAAKKAEPKTPIPKAEEAPEVDQTVEQAAEVVKATLPAEEVKPEPPAAEPPPEHPHQDALNAIAAASTKADLKRIFVQFKPAMKDDVLDALQARSKGLAA